jgi:hypothetical protein
MQHETYLKPSTGDHVPLERWFFVAVYNDGTDLRQFDDRDGTYHSFPEIDQERLQVFKMINSQTHQEVTVMFPAGAKLLHIYRNITLNHGTDDEQHYRWYAFGYDYKHISCKFVITHTNEVIFTEDIDTITIE